LSPAERWPAVAIVVPARDEEDLLPATLPTLLAQDYPGRARVVLVDDMSSDRTASRARSLAEAAPHPKLELRVVTGRPRPAGWAGKPWAMAQGVEAAMEGVPRPEWFLFTDADIAHPPSSLRRLVEAATNDDRGALSLMARLSTGTGWERLLMPAFVYFFAQIYPFSWVNDRERRTAAAAGGCLLVQARALVEAGGTEAIAGSTIDDVAMAKAIKGAGFDIWLGLAGGDGPDDAPDVKSLRRYPHLAGIWEMVARNAYTQLHYNPAALAGTVAGLAVLYVSPPLMAATGVATGRAALAGAGLAAWTAMTATYVPIVRYYRASPAGALALPFTASVYAAMTVSSALRHHRRASARKSRPS
jgi:hopene-associated glycosyltransferase HpnB